MFYHKSHFMFPPWSWSSAGVGRTGTFITLDSMMDMAAREQQINVLDFIYRMRTKRVKMVQTPVR